MKLEPIPEILKGVFDEDSLVYQDDNTFLYGKNINETLIKDIEDKNFQVYNAKYTIPDDKPYPYIWLLGRGRTCGKQIFKVENFFPYCYIHSKGGKYKTYLGKEVDKVLFESIPRKVADLRKHFERASRDITKKVDIPKEADIPYCRRFLIDTYDFFKPKDYVPPDVCIMDLETNFPENNDIIAFSINGYDGDLYYNSYYDCNHSELILDLYTRLMKYDILTNWNVDFDVNALRVKLEHIDLAMQPIYEGYELSKDDYVRHLFTEYANITTKESSEMIEALEQFGFLDCSGDIVKKGKNDLDLDLDFLITPVDLMMLSKKMYAREINGRWSLDNVGKQMCGIGKVETTSRYPRDYDEETLKEYNIMDVIIPEVIDNYLGGIDCHVILAWSVQSTIKDVLITAVVNDLALLREYHRDGIVLPSRPPYTKDTSNETYKAAEPDARPGVYKNVLAFDLHAAYPSAVIAVNASCESKDPNGKYEAPNGVRFNEHQSTFIRTLKDLLTDRERVKKSLKTLPKNSPEWRKAKHIDFALKTQVAAFSHGIFGWSNSRMKDLEVADAITSTVRGILDVAKDVCDKMGNPWVYCHTDSVYIQGKKENVEKLHKAINDAIDKYCKERNYAITPSMDYKGFYPNAYIHSPARNVLVDENGEWHPTGMNYMRSEVPQPLKEIEMELISMKLKDDGMSAMLVKLKEKILELTNLPTESLGIVKPLTKPIEKYGRKGKDGTKVGIPYHISALMKSKEDYGFEVTVGDKFCVIPIATNEYEGVRVIRRKRVYMAYPIDDELPSMYEIDWENYLISNLFGKIHTLFDMTAKQLREIILTDDVKEVLNIEEPPNVK